jgi:hypothetical protein
LIDNFIKINYNHLLSVSKKIINKNGRFDDPHELLNYSVLQLLEHNKREEIIESGFGVFWIIRVMTNSIYSNTSQFHKMMRNDCDVLNQDIEDEVVDKQGEEDLLNDIEDILLKIENNKIEGWYIANIFKLYIENPNYNHISRETGIPRKSITNAVKTCRALILQELKNNKKI